MPPEAVTVVAPAPLEASRAVESRPNSKSVSQSLDSERNAHSTADAQCRQSIAALPLLHFMRERCHNPRPRASDGMAKGNGASIHVEFLRIDRQLTQAGEHLGSERLIHFYKIKLLQFQTRLRKQLPDGPHRADTHNLRIDSGNRVINNSRQRFQIARLRLFL